VAVRKAFAAINVGNPSDETAPRIRVRAAFVHGYGPLNPQGRPDAFFGKMPVVAMGFPLAPFADVSGTDNKAVTWKLGGILGSRAIGGVIGADGLWTPPYDRGFFAMTVASVADPLQFATMRAFVVNGDADGDTEFDAMDLGAVALSWGLTGWVSATHGIVGDGFTDSMDVLAIVEAFKNAFGGA
jgi:hypothetical protein